MVHVRATPGTPTSRHTVTELVNIAKREAGFYKQHAFDGVLIENMHDIPYVLHSGPELTAIMARICSEVKCEVKDTPVGVQVLACQNIEAMAIALAAGLDFIRVENFVFGHIADEGQVNACAGQLLRYRRTIGAENVLVFTDIKKKHCSHSLTQDLSIKDVAEAAKFFLSDGLIVTGSSTGVAANLADVTETRQTEDMPLLIGSGVTNDNVASFFNAGANGVIVGSYVKQNGLWSNELDEERIAKLANECRK
jgi:membrane complex biogenesis BtpA family protein